MPFEDAIQVDDPYRAARALAALRGGLNSEADEGGWIVAEPGSLIRFSRRATGGGSFLHLRIETDHSVERIVELACAIGFHAESIGADERQPVECWIDEYLLIEARPALKASRQALAA